MAWVPCRQHLHSRYVEYICAHDLSDYTIAKDSASARSRLTFLHNPVLRRKDPGQHTRVSLLFSHLVYKGLLSKVSPSNLLQAIDFLNQPRPGQTLLDMPYAFDEITGGIALADLDEDVYHQYVEASRLVAEKVGLVPGAAGLIINGRVRITASNLFLKRDTPCIGRWADRFRRIHCGGLPNASGL